ncbi:hypothetical protein ON010_g17480 [Phytophthora cinnamomi]|nr:hypothetical protein ON010_g17480 [Phytophthora cinnamomi]
MSTIDCGLFGALKFKACDEAETQSAWDYTECRLTRTREVSTRRARKLRGACRLPIAAALTKAAAGHHTIAAEACLRSKGPFLGIVESTVIDALPIHRELHVAKTRPSVSFRPTQYMYLSIKIIIILLRVRAAAATLGVCRPSKALRRAAHDLYLVLEQVAHGGARDAELLGEVGLLLARAHATHDLAAFALLEVFLLDALAGRPAGGGRRQRRGGETHAGQRALEARAAARGHVLVLGLRARGGGHGRVALAVAVVTGGVGGVVGQLHAAGLVPAVGRVAGALRALLAVQQRRGRLRRGRVLQEGLEAGQHGHGHGGGECVDVIERRSNGKWASATAAPPSPHARMARPPQRYAAWRWLLNVTGIKSKHLKP